MYHKSNVPLRVSLNQGTSSFNIRNLIKILNCKADQCRKVWIMNLEVIKLALLFICLYSAISIRTGLPSNISMKNNWVPSSQWRKLLEHKKSNWDDIVVVIFFSQFHNSNLRKKISSITKAYIFWPETQKPLETICLLQI